MRVLIVLHVALRCAMLEHFAFPRGNSPTITLCAAESPKGDGDASGGSANPPAGVVGEAASGTVAMHAPVAASLTAAASMLPAALAAFL
jgi:hypothetical protein